MTDRPARTSPSEGQEAIEAPDPLDLDAVLEVLANRRRRYALYMLDQTHDGLVGFPDLVDEVTTLTAAVDGVAVTTDLYHAVATDLYHWHLPVLTDVGLVDCDARHRTVRYVRSPSVEVWVERLRADELG